MYQRQARNTSRSRLLCREAERVPLARPQRIRPSESPDRPAATTTITDLEQLVDDISVGETFGLIAFVVVALGGFGSVLGSLYAGLIIGLIQSASAFWLSTIYKDIVVYGLFVALLWLRPQGLMGKA